MLIKLLCKGNSSLHHIKIPTIYGKEISSINNILEMIFSLIGNATELEEIIALMKGRKTSGEIETQLMDFEKVNKYTGWKPKHSLEQGLSKTIDWYVKYLRK